MTISTICARRRPTGFVRARRRLTGFVRARRRLSGFVRARRAVLILAAYAAANIASHTASAQLREHVHDVGGQPGADSLDLEAVEKLIVGRTNAFRADHGLAALEVDAQLRAAADDFARFMALTDEYSHTADGRHPEERVKQHGYTFCIVAENIAYAYRSSGFSDPSLAEEFAQGWINSPPHRKNMLDAAVTDIGVGIARSEKTGHYYAVQEFALPRTAAIAFDVSNDSSRTVRYELGEQSYSLSPGYSRTHTECRVSRLEFSLGRRAKSGSTSFAPGGGDRFVVAGDKRSLSVSKR
jgi:uncharacterized protein YkwD